jgi:hypothetical protein
MPDREKVISTLEEIKTQTAGIGLDSAVIAHTFIDKIIAMLKEQEAVEPEIEVLNEIDRLYRCSRCHKHFFYEKQKYCDECGRAVKWNDLSL